VVTESGAQQAVAGDALQRVVTSNGFQIHEKKTSLRGFWQRQLLTGLVVNERANVPRRFVRQIRGMLHAWKAFGEEAAQAEFELRYKRQRAPFFPMPRFRDVLRGKIEFVGMVRGFRDPVYLSFHTLYCELADVKFVQKNRLDHLVHLEDAIWIVEGDKYQGTAFFLTGVGLVTCAHVLEGASVVFDSRSPSNKFPVRVIKSDIKRDVAVLEFPHAPRRLLRKGSSVLPKSGTPVTVCGFPEWAPGVSMWTSRGEVAAVRAPFGQPRVYTTGVISAGASGAPVFDLNRNVIGIAAIGAQRLDETIERGPHAFIPLQQLLDVLDT
jgi:hypothetical protein